VWKNVPVTAEYPDEDVLREMQYRSKLELTENVRIVTIEGVDRCACCAPHVKLTGEIGAIKLSDPMRHRGGMRITLYAGKNAVLDYADKYKNVQAIGAMLSARQWETAEAVERLLNENAEKKREIAELKMQIVKLKAESIAGTEGDILIFEDGLDAKAMRELANIAVSKCGGLCMVLSGTDAAGYSYIAASRTADMRAFAKDIAALGGKGGGSKEMVQGRITAKREEIEKFISERYTFALAKAFFSPYVAASADDIPKAKSTTTITTEKILFTRMPPLKSFEYYSFHFRSQYNHHINRSVSYFRGQHNSVFKVYNRMYTRWPLSWFKPPYAGGT